MNSLYFFVVPPHEFGCWIMLRTALIADARRASAVVNGEKLEQLNDGKSMVFTVAARFTGASSVSPEARGEKCGLKKFLSQELLPI